ncbi:hypothetical protein BGZ82_004163, partial [Podila clonocystis]
PVATSPPSVFQANSVPSSQISERMKVPLVCKGIDHASPSIVDLFDDYDFNDRQAIDTQDEIEASNIIDTITAANESPESTPPAPTHNHVSNDEFPNGIIELPPKDVVGNGLRDPYSVGWFMNVNSTRRKKGIDKEIIKSCLGNYECPYPGCLQSERPRIPNCSKYGALPRDPSDKCPDHDCDFNHIPCDCHLTITIVKNKAVLKHTGFHNHRQPLPARPTDEAFKKLKAVIEATPGITPGQLAMGSDTAPAAVDLHL